MPATLMKLFRIRAPKAMVKNHRGCFSGFGERKEDEAQSHQIGRYHS